jgi:hypothetical protein
MKYVGGGPVSGFVALRRCPMTCDMTTAAPSKGTMKSTMSDTVETIWFGVIGGGGGMEIT